MLLRTAARHLLRASAASAKRSAFLPTVCKATSTTAWRLQSSVAVATAAQASSQEGRQAYNVSQTLTGTDACKQVGIDALGITGPTQIYRNLTYQELYDHEVANNEGQVANTEYGQTFAVDTGKFTGRSPNDRWIVENPGSETQANLDWNSINQATTPEVFEDLNQKAVDYFNTRQTVYVFDGYCGASPATRKKIRFVHEMAWQQHFGKYTKRRRRLLIYCLF